MKYSIPRLLPVLSRSCWSTSTTSLSINIYLVVEQCTLLKQFLVNSNHINSLLAVSTSLTSYITHSCMLSPTPPYSMSHYQWQTLLLCEPRTQYQHLEPQGEWMCLSLGKKGWLPSNQCYVFCIAPGTQRWSHHFGEQSRSHSELVSLNV